MSFGGAANSMNQAIRSNRALQRKKSQAYFTDERLKSLKSSQKPFQFKTPQPHELRRLEEKWQAEQRKDRRRALLGWGLGVVTLLAIIISCWDKFAAI